MFYLNKMENTKIGIAGASTTGTLALVAASYFKERLSLSQGHRVTLYGKVLCKEKEINARNGP